MAWCDCVVGGIGCICRCRVCRSSGRVCIMVYGVYLIECRLYTRVCRAYITYTYIYCVQCRVYIRV